jgi:hypothetical protein
MSRDHLCRKIIEILRADRPGVAGGRRGRKRNPREGVPPWGMRMPRKCVIWQGPREMLHLMRWSAVLTDLG